MKKITIQSTRREDILDLTPLLQGFIHEQRYTSGILIVYSPHTTAAISVNENADPDVKADIQAFLRKTIPQDPSFAHMEGNSDAHIKGSLTGFSQTFIVEDGQIQLGTWQGIFFMEFDGPRQREVWVKFMGD